MTPILRKKSTPVYSIESISQFPMNPYRLFVFHCANTIYPSIENKLNMSLKDFSKLERHNQEAIIMNAFRHLPDVEIKFSEKPPHVRVFLEFEVKNRGSHICLVQFFTHLTYIAGNNENSSNEQSDTEYVACEVNFTEFDGFDFTDVSRRGNVIDFAKSDSDNEVMDMFIAHILGLIDFTEFVKVYKAKLLVIKNINLFCDKLIAPYVSDIQTAFSPDQFIIGAICGDNIHKMTYSYDNYLESVKTFSNAIKTKYGEKYKIEKEEREAKKNNNQ